MPKIKTKITYILKIIFWILLIYVIYNLFKFIVRSMTNYDDYYYLENLFTHQEIEELRKCTEENVAVNTQCFLDLHNLLKQKIEEKLGKKFIFASSTSVYGDKNNKKVNENEKLEPVTSYGKSKKNYAKI